MDKSICPVLVGNAFHRASDSLAMSPDDVIRAVDHSYRQAVLQVLREDQLTYSRLFATVEPEVAGEDGLIIT